jgi:hypothetical protein
MWESVLSVETYLECGRYLVFHRVVAYWYVEQMEDFMKDQGLGQQFQRMATTHLCKIKSLRLDWCKTTCLITKQWLTESELGVLQILPFLYGLFVMNVKCPTWSNISKNTDSAIQ